MAAAPIITFVFTFLLGCDRFVGFFNQLGVDILQLFRTWFQRASSLRWSPANLLGETDSCISSCPEARDSTPGRGRKDRRRKRNSYREPGASTMLQFELPWMLVSRAPAQEYSSAKLASEWWECRQAAYSVAAGK